jgi:putative two-component system response regulator
MRVLVVEDDCVTAETLAHCLDALGYEVTTANDGREAFELVRTGLYRLVVSDWEMPHMSGVELCRRIRRRRWAGYIYVILLTAYDGLENLVQGLEAGADDFLTKPFQPQELRVRLRAGERILGLESRDLLIFSLAKLADSRDPETAGHLERIREYSRILADELSHWRKYRDYLDGEYVQLLYLTTPLHDIGKVGIPDNVLLKPGRLTQDEFEIMKQHSVIGARTLEMAVGTHPEAQFLTMAHDIALTHHERYDGRGYPNGLDGESIPLCGRITALADVYDALTSKRVYKPKFTHETARSIILEGRGTQFDPDIVDSFLHREADFLKVGMRLGTDDTPPPPEEEGRDDLSTLAQPTTA